MSEPIQTPVAFVRFSRKTTPKQYESAEASVSVPVELDQLDPGKFYAGTEFWANVNTALNAAKLEVFNTLELGWEIDSDGNVQESFQTGAPAAAMTAPVGDKALALVEAAFPGATDADFPETLPACPKCGSGMWDNRGTADKPKRNPKAPDFKCKTYKDTGCDGVIWPPR